MFNAVIASLRPPLGPDAFFLASDIGLEALARNRLREDRQAFVAIFAYCLHCKKEVVLGIG